MCFTAFMRMWRFCPREAVITHSVWQNKMTHWEGILTAASFSRLQRLSTPTLGEPQVGRQHHQNIVVGKNRVWSRKMTATPISVPLLCYFGASVST